MHTKREPVLRMVIIFLTNANANMYSFHNGTKGKWPKATHSHTIMINASIKCNEEVTHKRGATPKPTTRQLF